MGAVAGDKDIIRSALHSAVESKSRDQLPDSSSGKRDSIPVALANEVVSNGEPRWSHHDRDYDCLNLIDCPIGAPGTPGYAEVRERYRHFTDADLWNICTAERTMAYGYVHDVACALIASPDPWRPVETPRDLERAAPLSADEYDLMTEVANKQVEQPGEVFDDYALPPCKKNAATNDTLTRKRPSRDCRPPEVAK